MKVIAISSILVDGQHRQEGEAFEYSGPALRMLIDSRLVRQAPPDPTPEPTPEPAPEAPVESVAPEVETAAAAPASESADQPARRARRTKA